MASGCGVISSGERTSNARSSILTIFAACSSGRTNLSRNSLDIQPLTGALQFLPVDDDLAGNVDQVSELDHVGDHLERQLYLFASQTFGAERYASHIPSRTRLTGN